MEKCRYSTNGECINNEVSCEKCGSTELEMENCLPLQRCIILHDDNWIIEEDGN